MADPKLKDISLAIGVLCGAVGPITPANQVVIAASSSIAIARAAFEAAVEAHPNENLALRNGVLVIREYFPGA